MPLPATAPATTVSTDTRSVWATSPPGMQSVLVDFHPGMWPALQAILSELINKPQQLKEIVKDVHMYHMLSIQILLKRIKCRLISYCALFDNIKHLCHYSHVPVSRVDICTIPNNDYCGSKILKLALLKLVTHKDTFIMIQHTTKFCPTI